MDTRHMIVPELLEPLAQYQRLDLSTATLADTRREMNERTALYIPAPDVVTEERDIAGPPGSPRVRILVSQPQAPATGVRPAVLWIHGGGYVLGVADRCRPVMDMFCHELDCVAVSPEYRLAPETVHPGPVEDCYATLAWMHANAADLGIDPDRVAVGGESAGGGLAAATAILARDRSEFPIAFQGLVYPMVDDRTVITTQPNPYAGEFVWTPSANDFGWRSLLGRDPGGDDISPYAAPSRLADFSGLPPAAVLVGALDLFVDEDIDYARRLMRAGVATELRVYPGAFHGFFSFDATRLGQRVRADMTAALRGALTQNG